MPYIQDYFEVKTKLQPLIVSGTVTDEAGETLPGVSIIIEGTTSGTITDLDGNYSIEPPLDGRLIFSYLGYEQQTVEINEQQKINVTLLEELTLLDEVVVIGYGSMQRANR